MHLFFHYQMVLKITQFLLWDFSPFLIILSLNATILIQFQLTF